MLKKLFTMTILLSGSLLFSSNPAFAENANTEISIDQINPIEINLDSSPSDPISIEQTDRQLMLDQKFLAWCNERGCHQGLNKDGKQIYFGKADVRVHNAHSDYTRFKTTAYEQAYTNALSSFVKSIGGQIISDARTSLFKDSGLESAVFDRKLTKQTDKIDALFNGLIALSDEKLNFQLSNMGINPEEFKSVPPNQKKVLFENALVKKIVSQVSKSLGGVSVINTFCAVDNKGKEAIGVILMYSPKLQTLTNSLKTERLPFFAKKGSPLTEQLPLNEPKKLADILGVRVLFDENGPCIVSFAQWANTYNEKNNILKRERRNASRLSASNTANTQLAEFLYQSVTTTSEQEQGERFKAAQIKSGQDFSMDEIIVPNLIDKIKMQSKHHSNTPLQGVSIISEWSLPLPGGREIIGVVKKYSFANSGIAAADDISAMTSDNQKIVKSAPDKTISKIKKSSVESAFDEF